MTAALINRPTIPYGARQLQEYIGKSTYRAFGATLALLASGAAALAIIVNYTQGPVELHTYVPPTVVTYYPPLTPAAPKSPVASPATVLPAAPGNAFKTPAATSGNFIPVPATIAIDPVATATEPSGSDGSPLGDNGIKNMDGAALPSENGGGTATAPKDALDAWDFNPVEHEPVLDYSALAKNLLYPDMAKRSGIEGKVHLRVLVGSDGRALQAIIIDSRHEALGRAAIDAILKTRFTPAVQNGQPVNCWLSIPVDFKLR